MLISRIRVTVRVAMLAKVIESVWTQIVRMKLRAEVFDDYGCKRQKGWGEQER